MPVYVTLMRFTDQGRKDIRTLPDRSETVQKRVEQAGAKSLGVYVTMGQYDLVAITEAPDDETIGKLALEIVGRGNATTETMRAFTMQDMRSML